MAFFKYLDYNSASWLLALVTSICDIVLVKQSYVIASSV